MKKSKILLILIVAALTLSLCGCGENGEKPNSTPDVTSSVISSSAGSSQESTGANTSTTASSVSSGSGESQVSSKSNGETDYTAKAKQLLEALDTVDKIGASALTTDKSKTVKKGDRNYEKVTDTRFADTAAIEKYMKEALTEKMIATRYSAILGTDSPRFIDSDGALYQSDAARGGGFPFSDEAPQISDTSDTGFTVRAKYDNYGAESIMTVKVVLDNNLWKIDSIDIG